MPHSNEFVPFLIYLVFAAYFWVESFMIIAKNKDYEFEDFSYDYFYMYIATWGIAFSLSITTAYLLVYSMSPNMLKIFEMYNFIGLLSMFYFYLFAYVVSEFAGAVMYFYLLFTIPCIFLTCMLAAIYEVP